MHVARSKACQGREGAGRIGTRKTPEVRHGRRPVDRLRAGHVRTHEARLGRRPVECLRDIHAQTNDVLWTCRRRLRIRSLVRGKRSGARQAIRRTLARPHRNLARARAARTATSHRRNVHPLCRCSPLRWVQRFLCGRHLLCMKALPRATSDSNRRPPALRPEARQCSSVHHGSPKS